MIKNNTDPFTINVSGFNRLIQITNCFILRSTNIIYCIACTPSKVNYIGETGRRLYDCCRLEPSNINLTVFTKKHAHSWLQDSASGQEWSTPLARRIPPFPNACMQMTWTSPAGCHINTENSSKLKQLNKQSITKLLGTQMPKSN